MARLQSQNGVAGRDVPPCEGSTSSAARVVDPVDTNVGRISCVSSTACVVLDNGDDFVAFNGARWTARCT